MPCGAGGDGGARARVHPDGCWAELSSLLRSAPAGQPAASEDGGAAATSRRLAEGLFDWQQLRLLVTVRPAGGWRFAGQTLK
jgi:hypothetical protein